MDRNTVVQHLPGDELEKTALKYQFKKLGEIAGLVTGPGASELVDVAGVVVSVTPAASIQRKDGSSTEKRSVILRDDSGFSIELTLWTPFSARPGAELEAAVLRGENPVLACKALRVSDFGGKSLGTVSSSALDLNPDIAQAAALRGWYDNGGCAQPLQQLSSGGYSAGAGGARQDRVVNFAQIKEETAAGLPGGAMYVQCRAYITTFKPNSETGVLYPACPLPADGAAQARSCQKKLRFDQTSGTWFCEKHAQSVPAPDHRYMISALAADWSGPALWLSAFGDVGDKLFGRSGGDMHRLFENNYIEYERCVKGVPLTMLLFKLKISQETYQEETRIKHSIMTVTRPAFADESRKLIESIKRMQRGEPAEIVPQQGASMHSLRSALRCAAL
jgi:replication factor A1